MSKKKRREYGSLNSTFDKLFDRLDEIEGVVWAAHFPTHSCDKWDCLKRAQKIAKSKDVH